MSILPAYEKINIPAKVFYEISLEYQVKKLLFFREKFITSLNRPRHINYVEQDCHYFLDAVINNAATLAEYYLPYVIYSIIGTVLTKPKKPWISNFRKDIENSCYQDAKSKLFKTYKIGVLKKSTDDYKDEYLKRCHDLFDSSIKFLFDGEYDIIFVLNNYIKHNSMTFDYAPLSNSDAGKTQSHLFLSFTKDQHFMLGKSTLKTLISCNFENINQNDNETFTINNINFVKKGNMGGIMLLENNNIMYIKSSDFAGITSESLLNTINRMMITIVEHMISNARGHELSRFDNYKNLLVTIKQDE